jgi:hypothetical protein
MAAACAVHHHRTISQHELLHEDAFWLYLHMASYSIKCVWSYFSLVDVWCMFAVVVCLGGLLGACMMVLRLCCACLSVCLLQIALGWLVACGVHA